MPDLHDTLEALYETLEGSEMAEEYSRRHDIESLAVLTIYNNETAKLVARSLAPRIEDKRVIEIGGGIGLLALHLGVYAEHVYCIEANPGWSWAFVGCLYAGKPKNVSYLFGAADEFAGQITADIALCCTHSGVMEMKRLWALFAPEVIDVYGEIINDGPEGFDQLAVALRKLQ